MVTKNFILSPAYWAVNQSCGFFPFTTALLKAYATPGRNTTEPPKSEDTAVFTPLTPKNNKEIKKVSKICSKIIWIIFLCITNKVANRSDYKRFRVLRSMKYFY